MNGKLPEDNLASSTVETKRKCPRCKLNNVSSKYDVCFRCNEELMNLSRLRDLFAGRAMNGMMSAVAAGGVDVVDAARTAWRMADAMLETRTTMRRDWEEKP